MLTIKVRYCGGCNPEIDRVGLIERTKECLENKGLRARFVSQGEEDRNLVLLVNGCKHGCLEEQYPPSENDTPFISVKGEMVLNRYVPEKDIPEILIDRIIDLIKKKQEVEKETENGK